MIRIVWSFVALMVFAAAAIGLSVAFGSPEFAGSVVRGVLFSLVIFATTSFVVYRTRRR